MTGMHSLRGGRWGLVLQLPPLPAAMIPALQELHHGAPVMVTVLPHDADSLFAQINGDVVREKMSESRRNKAAVQRLWAATGCKGTLDEFYAARCAAWRDALEKEAKDNGGGL